MANIKSAIKQMRQSEKRRVRNRVVRSSMRTFVKKANIEIADASAESAEVVRVALSALDRAAQKGVIHRNAANRRKSRLMKRFNAAQQSKA